MVVYKRALFSPRQGIVIFATILSSFALGHGDEAGQSFLGFGKEAALAKSIRAEDSARISVDFSANSSVSVAPNGHQGEVLGTGGKMPSYYNFTLYQEQPHQSSYMWRRDLHTGPKDFGYIPLARGNSAFSRMRLRFSPSVSGIMALDFDASQNVEQGRTTGGRLSVGEISLKVAPESWRGMAFEMGTLGDGSVYVPIFQLSPFDAVAFQGLRLSRVSPGFGNPETNFAYRADLAWGTQYLGATFWKDLFKDATLTTAGQYRDFRNRNLWFGKFAAQYGSLTARTLFGYQSLPADSNIVFGQGTQYWNASSGAEAGLVLEWDRPSYRLSSLAMQGKGDVMMAFGAPDPVFFIREKSDDQGYLSRKGSSLTHLMTWGSWRHYAFTLDAGIWAMLSDPNPGTLRASNENKDQLNDPALATYRATLPDSLTLSAQPHRETRFSIQPSYGLLGFVRAGLRVDHIRFLNPDASSNTQEIQFNPANEPIPVGNRSSGAPVYLKAPSKWESEAVNATVLSPMLTLAYAEIGRIDFIYSGGFYDQPISRHGEVGTFHSNFSVNAAVNIRFSAGSL